MRARTIVLVHGAWADGSCWSKVTPLLLKRGFEVTAVQLPLTSLADDVAALKRAVALAEGPIVLGGHSYGGVTITEAGRDPKVSALAYIAAFAPDAGESAGSLGQTVAAPPLGEHVRPDAQGFLKLTRVGVFESFAQDLAEGEKAILYATQGPTAAAALAGTVTVPAWRSKPAWYLVASSDRAIQPGLQRRMASRMNAKTTEVNASHLAMLARPEDTAHLLALAAA